MAADPCARRNPLVRSGLTQDGRRRAELASDHFLPDERDLADLVLFAQRFARHIAYYDAENKKAGDWTAFFESDVTASLAALSKLPVDAFRTFTLDLETWLKAESGREDDQLSAYAKLGLHLPFALFGMAGAHHARLPGDQAFVPAVIHLAGRSLEEPLRRLIAYYSGALAAPVLGSGLGQGNEIFTDTPLARADYNIDGAEGDTRLRLSSTIADALIGNPKLSDAVVPDRILTQIPPGNWRELFDTTTADPSPYVDAIGAAHQRYEQIYDALSYNLLTTAVEQIYQGMERIRRDAAAHLAASLESFAQHTPHYGLWLAFLQLFSHAQGELNRFTERHLDFYFRDVLRLSRRAAAPDNAHLVFELAKGRKSRLLTAGTLFRAGKDETGAAVGYALEGDIVVNTASVAELRGLRIETAGTTARPAQTPRAAAVVKSRDGPGEVELAAGDPAWPPFGPAASLAARIGFAIADRKLFLREGDRTIIVRAELKSPLPVTRITPRWTVRLTGDEGWFEIAGNAEISTRIDNAYVETDDSGARPGSRARPGAKLRAMQRTRQRAKAAKASIADRKRGPRLIGPGRELAWGGGGRKSPPGKTLHIIEITVTLDADDPPVVPLDAKLHGAEHAPGVPVIEIAFDFDAATTARAFAELRDLEVDRVTLRTEAKGLKNLMVAGGGGVADVSKPFAPFGAQPRTGAEFIIGSSEIFSKSIEAWRLEVDWEARYNTTGFFRNRTADQYNPQEYVLAGGRWSLANALRTIVFGRGRPARRIAGHTDIHLGEDTATIELESADLIDGLTEQTLENPPLDAKSVNGFMRMRLPLDFGHAAYVVENTRALVGLAGGAAYSPSPGVNPYDSDPGKGTKLLPHEPFNPVITRLEAAYETPREEVEAFSHLHPFGAAAGTADGRLFPEMPFEGALLIGVADFAPPARLTLLIQVADGSGDPLKKAPDLEFALLDGDTWIDFEPQDVDDKTVNLTGSGVLGLNVPEEADTDHDVLPAGLHWIRIAAPRDADALNRLLSIDAQAARVAFADAGNDPAFLRTPLEAGAIAKLVTPDAAIKKIVQPYSSFGGRPLEAPGAFATRVSERLRHKDRAVTLWDYEALVLEAFPRLYRAKCLNTSELKRDGQNVIIADNELMPGAVTVVTVPWTHGQNARDPLRPYTDQATLTAVDAFLRRRVSPFVRLEVQNPKFEEVKVDFKVRFGLEIGDIAFYIDELNKAVIGYLTPWAREGGGEIAFGGRLWKSSIIDFVEEQPHVDFVTDFRLYHKIDIDAPDGGWSPVDVEVIEATTARSILVSASRHTINEAPANA